MAKRYDPIMCMLVDEPTKAQDAGFVLRHKNGQYMSSAGRTNEKAKAKVFSSKREAEAYKGDYVVSSTDPDYHNWSVVAVDSASALDKAIKTADGATGDKLYADVKAIYSLFSNVLLTYSNEQSVQKLANEGTKKCLELAAKVKGVRDEAIKACDAVEVETSKWSFSSGKSKPSGFGNWWFKIGTEEKNFSGNWPSAKAEAIKYAKEKGINRISLMT